MDPAASTADEHRYAAEAIAAYHQAHHKVTAASWLTTSFRILALYLASWDTSGNFVR